MKTHEHLRTTASTAWLWLALVAAPHAHAGPRTSAAYTVLTDGNNSGGRRATSASYTNVGCVGLVSGTSTAAAPAGTAKAGYIGQLYEVTGFFVSSFPSTLNEGGTRQLGAAQLLDDATELAVDPAEVSWTVLNGPITSISAGGLATASTVYQHTAATVRGTYQGSPDSFTLTVLNVTDDDLGSYAGDGIDDAWQVQHFGFANPLANPDADPDRDGQDNRFEFAAGLIPTDSQSIFKLRTGDAGSNTIGKVTFGPRFNDRIYTVEFRLSLAAPPDWAELAGALVHDDGLERTVTDPNPTGTKFYRIKITKP